MVSAETTPLVPEQLVRAAVQNELKAKNDPTKFMFRDHKHSLTLNQTKLIVQTRDAMVGMIVGYDDLPLNPRQKQDEEARVERFVHDPNELAKKQAQEKDDSDRVERIIKALPDAFLFEADGTEPGRAGMGITGEELVRLKFRPNPQYDPPTRVEQVLTGMQGIVLIDARRNRLAQIEGTLVKDVGFGWGILGHLDRGGHIVIEQGEVAPDIWKITGFQYAFTGKVLLFKSINSRTKETFSDFHQVPPNLSFAEGFEVLKKQENAVAENFPQSK